MVIPFKRPERATDAQKQNYVFKSLCAEYKAVDNATNAVNIPYFLRASQKLREIIQNDSLDKEYNERKKKNGKKQN